MGAHGIAPFVVVDAFSSTSGIINQRTQTQTRARQPSQQPSSLLPPLAYLMRKGDDIDAFNNNDDSKKTTATAAPSTSIPRSTRTRTDTTGSTISLNNYVDEKMIADLQNQHLQMMEIQQRQQQPPSSYSVTILLSHILLPSMTLSSPTTTTITTAVATTNDDVGSYYEQLHDDLTYLNIQLLRSKVAFLHRLLPQHKKQHIERFVNFLIQFIL